MRLMVELEVGGSKRKARVEALVDTGFSGHLCLPVDVAKDLGLILSGSEKYELANGQWTTQLSFQGYVVFLDKKQEVEIIVGDSDTPQIGLALLGDCRLSVDFASSKVRLTRKKM